MMDSPILDSIAGDLEEERRRRAAKSSAAARVWFWRAWLGIRIYSVCQRIRDVIGGLGRPGGRGEWRATMRSLASAPAYSLTSVAVIALSMGLATTVFAVVDGVLFKPLPFTRADELVVIRPFHHDSSQDGPSAVSPNDVVAWRAALPDVPLTAARVPLGAPSARIPIGPEINALQVQTADIDADFLRVLNVQPMLGGLAPDSFQVTSNGLPRSALLTYALWQTAFGGDPHVIGRVVTITEQPRVAFEIDGVLPPSFVSPTRVDAQMFFATTALLPGALSRRAYQEVIARIPRGQSTEVVRQRIEAAMSSVPPDPRAAQWAGTLLARQTAPYDRATIVPLGRYVNGWQERIALAVFAAALVLVLLGGVNVSGLVVARGCQRARDIVIRRALGAGTLTIVRFVFAEVATIVVIGTAAGVGLARPMLSVTLAVLPFDFHPLKSVAIDWRVAAFAAIAALLGAVLMTVAPARRALGRSIAIQAESTAITRRQSPGSRANIATQVALGMTLAVGGALIVGSLIDVWQEPVGFDRRAVAISLRLRRAPQAGGVEDVAAMLERVRRVPGVESAGVMDAMLLQNAMQGSQVEPPASIQATDVGGVPITPGFFDVARPTLVAGRYPTASELQAGTALAVSSMVAGEFWPGAPAVGQTLTANGATLTVVGVVEDARYMSWDFAEGVIYEPYSTLGHSRTPNLFVRGVHGADPPIADVLAAIGSLGSWVQATRVDPLDELLAQSIRDRRFNAWLFGAFSGGALAIVLTGLLGLVAMTAAQRTREVGVRMALGATPDRVVGLLVRETAGAVVIGIVSGGLVSIWAARYLKASMYQMGVYDPRLWTAATAAMLIAAGIGAFVPALRASRIDPVRALRVD